VGIMGRHTGDLPAAKPPEAARTQETGRDGRRLSLQYRTALWSYNPWTTDEATPAVERLRSEAAMRQRYRRNPRKPLSYNGLGSSGKIQRKMMKHRMLRQRLRLEQV
jgi:hypothetical protein